MVTLVHYLLLCLYSIAGLLGISYLQQIILRHLRERYVTDYATTLAQRIRIGLVVYYLVIALLVELMFVVPDYRVFAVNLQKMLLIMSIYLLKRYDSGWVLALIFLLRLPFIANPVIIGASFGTVALYVTLTWFKQRCKLWHSPWRLPVFMGITVVIWLAVVLPVIPEPDRMTHLANAMATLFALTCTLLLTEKDQEQLQSLNYEAHRDQLTQVYNFNAFSEKYGVLTPIRLLDRQMVVISFDIDRFKQINDEFGHQAGNEVLSWIGRLARSAIADVPDALAYRVGGEEFNLILPQQTMIDGHVIADQLVQMVRETQIPIEGGRLGVTLSVGVATVRDSDEVYGHVFNRVDQLVYDSKRNGRDQITFQDDEQ